MPICGPVPTAQWKPTDPRVAKAHEDLADYYSAEGRYADAERVYQKTLELEEDMLGRANPAIIPAIKGRGWITGLSTYLLDPDDPFPEGYLLSDTWPGPDTRQ